MLTRRSSTVVHAVVSDAVTSGAEAHPTLWLVVGASGTRALPRFRAEVELLSSIDGGVERVGILRLRGGRFASRRFAQDDILERDGCLIGSRDLAGIRGRGRPRHTRQIRISG